jgi:hypothetical protein
MAKLYDALKPLGDECQEMLFSCISQLNIKLLVNMVRDPKERNVSDIIKSVAKNYLGLDIEHFGIIQYDNVLDASINKMSGFLISGKECVANINFYDIAYKMVKDLTRQRELINNYSQETPPSAPNALSSTA